MRCVILCNIYLDWLPVPTGVESDQPLILTHLVHVISESLCDDHFVEGLNLRLPRVEVILPAVLADKRVRSAKDMAYSEVSLSARKSNIGLFGSTQTIPRGMRDQSRNRGAFRRLECH